MKKDNAKQLFLKYNQGTATRREKALVESWILKGTPAGANLTDEELLNDLIEIRARLGLAGNSAKTSRLWPRIAAAASILIFLSVGGYFLLRKQPNKTDAANYSALKQDAAPGGNKAVLMLANGKSIVLNDAKNGKLAEQGAVAIDKTSDGQIVYNTHGASVHAASKIAYNTMTTPRGGQYHLTLADGTNVWLNAASSLKYPVVFTGGERKVELTGEAYFEVVHNNAKPFRVVTNGETIEDIGTHFNVFAYGDEKAVKTTLLEGAVKVSTAASSVFLKPGQQSSVNQKEAKIDVASANIDEAVAWKNGLFEFNRADIPTVMRSLGRWYDLDIAYDGNIPQRRF